MKTSKEPTGMYSTHLDLPMTVIIPFLFLSLMVIWLPDIRPGIPCPNCNPPQTTEG